MYCAGNPVKLVDVDGCQFADSITNVIISNFRQKISEKNSSYESKISQWNSEINSGSLSRLKCRRRARWIARARRNQLELSNASAELDILTGPTRSM